MCQHTGGVCWVTEGVSTHRVSWDMEGRPRTHGEASWHTGRPRTARASWDILCPSTVDGMSWDAPGRPRTREAVSWDARRPGTPSVSWDAGRPRTLRGASWDAGRCPSTRERGVPARGILDFEDTQVSQDALWAS